MECISENTVEETWQLIAEMEPEKAAESMFEFAEAQPNLLGFVMAFAEELDADAKELSTYLLYVVYQMFARSSKSPIPMISEEQVTSQYDATEALLSSLHEAGEKPSEDLAYLESANQPWVYRYVAEALLESDETDDPEEQLDLTEEDFGEVFMMLKTVIDAVDAATN
jgi:hypothetical protein